MGGDAWIRKRIKAALRGDISAYGDLVHLSQSGLRGFIAMLGTPPHAVENIAADTFVLAYKKLNMYDPDRSFSDWLRGIARNVVEQWREKRRPGTANGERIAAHLMSGEIRDVVLKEEEKYRTGNLCRCLDKLPARSRRMLDLKYSDRKTSSEIAGELELETAAARLALFRVRLKLRDCIDKLAVAQEAG